MVLERGAGLPVAPPRREAREPRVAVVPFAAATNGACGNPDVCSITCSTVMTSLPLVAELGDVLARRAATTSIAPSPIRTHTALATTGFVAEKIT